ncbi:hypothetical protein BKA83DRAFT_671456 [Pisolithus microcarpus]|nr:hypothetical protein BKA83DRAFT_671456 [Pisolithus microcarpus]
MPPRGNEGLDFTPILTHYLFLFTTILAVFAWFIAFISQAIATAQIGSVNVAWFGIFLQLFLILGVIYTLASWLILAIVDILWVLYFTSEEDSLAWYLLNSLGTGGLTPPSRRRRTRGPSVHGMGTNGYTPNYGGGISSHDVPYDSATKTAPGLAVRSQNSFVGGASNDGGAPRSLGPAAGAGSIHSNQNVAPSPLANPENNLGANSPLMGPGAAGVGAGGGAPEQPPEQDLYLYKAKALYAYTASPDDPNEISFTKGEVLDIIDKQGKWWQARKVDGTIGIAPSNYLQLI